MNKKLIKSIADAKWIFNYFKLVTRNISKAFILIDLWNRIYSFLRKEK